MEKDQITTLAPGTLLHFGTYRIERFLAKGGFGCTYLATHVMLDEPVAVKELFISDYCNRDASGTISVAVTSRVDFVEKLHSKFIDEAKAQRRMNHPGIVKVSDVFEENGTAYYIMDFIDGESLSNRLKRLGHSLTEEEAVTIRYSSAPPPATPRPNSRPATCATSPRPATSTRSAPRSTRS